MLTTEQLTERLKYIGGSDAPGVLGLSRWSSPLKVWAEKTGEIVREDIGDKLYVKLGHLLEDDMTQLFEDQTGKVLHRVNETQFHPQYDFIACNIDRRVVGENVPVELKTANAFKNREWQGEEIPREYIIQCMHTLAITGKPYMYLGVLIGSQEFQIKKVDRDESVIDQLISREVAFWRGYVETKIMPLMVTKYDAGTLDDLWPQATQTEPIQMGDMASQLIESLDGFKKDIKQLEGLVEKTENELKLILGANEMGVTPTGATAKWSNSKWSGLDGKALKEDLPQIHAQYYKSKPIRKFSYSLRQEIK